MMRSLVVLVSLLVLCWGAGYLGSLATAGFAIYLNYGIWRLNS